MCGGLDPFDRIHRHRHDVQIYDRLKFNRKLISSVVQSMSNDSIYRKIDSLFENRFHSRSIFPLPMLDIASKKGTFEN
jgi:hypothetical protein